MHSFLHLVSCITADGIPASAPASAQQCTASAWAHRSISPCIQARKAAEVAEAAQRLMRIAELAGGGSKVTLSSLATVDDDSEAMQRINIILKVGKHSRSSRAPLGPGHLFSLDVAEPLGIT